MDKPLCRKCGLEHWRFVKCIEAPHENAYDQAKVEYAEAHRVIPEHRSRPAAPMTFLGRNFIEQAPGVYRRRRVQGR